MIIDYISQKIKILSLFAILLVLFIHSGFHEADTFALNAMITELFSGILGNVAVPLFYVISGYLFFWHT